jgi:6-phosphofructokinase 1
MAIHRIGVLTSGGDGPGFNPCLRAATRMALSLGVQVVGIKRGYTGLLNDEFVELTARSVGGIIDKGGTFLGTSRSLDFKSRRGQMDALRNLNDAEIDGLVVIGGDGTMRGAQRLHELGLPIMGVPGTIDNDVGGTDLAIGVDTALNTALDAIDRIKDTASSLQRAFVVEVMGRESGYLALMTGLAGGAEMACIPEVPFELEDVARTVTDAYVKGKSHAIICVAEGARYNAVAIAEYLRERHEEAGFSVRMTILGHIQRGGAPLAFDRLLATRLGAAAAQYLIEGRSGEMVGLIGNEIASTPFEEVIAERKPIDVDMYRLAEVLAR